MSFPSSFNQTAGFAGIKNTTLLNDHSAMANFCEFSENMGTDKNGFTLIS